MSAHEETRSIKYSSAGSTREDTVRHDNASTIHHDDEFVYLDGKKHLKSELMYAFGGDFNPGLHLAPHLKLGNATPMGLFAFATTTLILSFYNSNARGVSNHGAMLGVGLFYGGAIQVVAGVWELIIENSFGATVFTAYGGFWMSFSVLTMKHFDIRSAYTDPKEFDNALGLYFLAWAIVTSFFALMTLRSTVALFVLLFSSCLNFMLLAASNFCQASGNKVAGDNLLMAAGVIGCWVAMAAYYNGLSGLVKKENSWVNIRPVYMPGAIRPEESKAKET